MGPWGPDMPVRPEQAPLPRPIVFERSHCDNDCCWSDDCDCDCSWCDCRYAVRMGS